MGTEVRGAAANRNLLADLELGADLLFLGLRGPGALPWRELADLDELFAGVELRFVRGLLEVDADRGLAAACLLWRWAEERGIARQDLRFFLGFDPLGSLARQGQLPGSLDEAWRQAASLVRFTRDHAPESRALTASAVPFAEAGAGPAQILGATLANLVETLRRLAALGISPAKALAQIVVVHAASSEIFLEIAKLRAMRWLVARVARELGAEAEAARQIHLVTTSAVELTRVDPWVNLLRGTAQVFAAAVGGADGILVWPYDRALGQPDPGARRMAMTTQQVLAEESHLARVADPAGGSYALDQLTTDLARRAWTFFQEIESQGGLAAALLAGDLQRRLGQVAAERAQEVAKRRRVGVGVSVFANLDENRPTRQPWPSPPAAMAPEPTAPTSGSPASALQAGAELKSWIEATLDPDALQRAAWREPATSAPPLVAYYPYRIFESLRLAADAAAQRPAIFLANLGPSADHRARTEFCQGLFPIAGFATVEAGSFLPSPTLDWAELAAAWRQSGCRVAILCGTDEAYGQWGASAARALRNAGVERLGLAGRGVEHEAELREAGISFFAFLGADMAQLLRELQHALGLEPEVLP